MRSDSDNDGDKITYRPYRCICKCGATACSDYSDYDTDSDESFTDQSSSKETNNKKKIIFISIFNHKTQKNKNLISNSFEIQNYREKYQKLPLKNVKNIKNIWADVKIDIPLFGEIPLKHLDNELIDDKKYKKKFKKPTHLMQKNLTPNSSASNSEQSDIANKSGKIEQPKLSQAQIKKGNNKENQIKEANEAISKANIAAKNTAIKQNKNLKNESNKLTKPVINKSVKSQITKDNLESYTAKTTNSNSNILTNVQPMAENNSIKKTSNASNQKSSNENNFAKTSSIKTPAKAVAQNKVEKNEEIIKKTSVASPLLKEESTEKHNTAKINTSITNEKTILEDKSKNIDLRTSSIEFSIKDKTLKVNNLVKSEVKTNAKNKIEKINLVQPNTKSITENKLPKDDSLKPNVESDVKDQTSNNNLNNKKSKSEATEFKIPHSDKIIPSSNNKMGNSGKNKNLQSNKKVTVKKLSKKQERNKQNKRKLEANNRDTSTSSSKDVSMSSTKSFDDQNLINNSNKNVKKDSAKLSKKNVTKLEKNRTKNKKLTESDLSEQDMEESEIEEMNTSNDDLDLLTDTEHMPTFIADIIKRKEKNNKVKVKPVTKTPIKKKGKKNKEQEKIKIENEQEVNVNLKKRKHLPTANKNDKIYSDRYAEDSVKMILENNIMGALQCITAAINYNPYDYRHYLNRSYYYLRMSQPAYALTDAQYVIRLCTNIGQLFIANLRAGQATYALKNYEQAENYFKEATGINPENYQAQRELLRAKISHIMSLGFNEKDALMALQTYPSTLEAIGYLDKLKKNSSISEFKDDFNTHDYNCDDMVFSSDNEEESDNFKTLNRMLNYQPGEVKFHHLVAKPVKAEFLWKPSNYDTIAIPKINTDVKKKLVPTNKSANDKAIWVGSLTNNITEQMLKKKFKQFGNVVSIYRPCNEAYAFINFERSEDVTKSLTNTSAHEIAGVKLIVRSAVRQK